jgi:hypothetical protein
VLALIYSINPSFTPDQVQNILFSSATDIGATGYDINYGWGQIDAANAVAMALSAPSSPPPPVDSIAPSAPGNFKATAPDNTKVNLTWSASSDNVGVTGYEIFKGGVSLVKLGGSTLSYVDTAVSQNTTYSYYATASDAAGNISGKSTTATVTVPGVAAPVVSNIIEKQTTKGGPITISWTTNVDTTSVLLYGKSSSVLDQSVSDNITGRSHSATIPGSYYASHVKAYYAIKANLTGANSAISTTTSVKNLQTK